MTAETETEDAPREMEVAPASPLPADIQNIVEYLIRLDKIVFKSQQIDDQELQEHEKIQIATDIYVRNRQTFLQRFGGYMREQHLAAFAQTAVGEGSAPLNEDEHADEIQFLLQDLQRKLKTRQRDVKNRRYAALQQLIRKGDYFSEEEMMKRSPELYEELIGQYLSEAEKKQRDGYDVRNTTFSGILMHTFQAEEMRDKLAKANKQICKEAKRADVETTDSVSQIDDDSRSSFAPEEPVEVPPEFRQQWGNFENEQIACSTSKVVPKKKPKPKAIQTANLITAGERDLLRQEFLSIMHERFLEGGDEDFDYEAVDDDSQLDDLKTLDQDQEDAYFEESDDDEEPLGGARRGLGEQMESDDVEGQVESEDELDIYMSHLSKHPSLRAQY